MSWQPYIDESLIGEGFRHACITSHAGQAWAHSPNFVVSEKEAARILPVLEGDAEAEEQLKQFGFMIAGVSYALSRLETEDDEVRYLIGRCKAYGEPSRGIVIARTTRTLLFGVHDPIYSRKKSFEKCNAAMYALADLLVGMSF